MQPWSCTINISHFTLKMETNNFSKLDHPDFMMNYNKHKIRLCCQLFCPEYGDYDVSQTPKNGVTGRK
jgi:hypothetical protein